MKAIFTFMALLFLCLIAISNNSERDKQKKKEPVKPNSGINNDSLNNINNIADTLPNYSIHINGKSNSVQITSDNPVGESQNANSKVKNNLNALEINGEENSVNISQSGNGGKVEIKQTGNHNQINISQSVQDKEKLR
jgi:hypothetical protein